MKTFVLSIPLIAYIGTLVSADQWNQRWNEDPRCDRRLAFDPREQDDRRVMEANIFKRSDSSISNKSHRGSHASSHRQLDIFHFQMKMYWEEGYCWQSEWDEREWCLACEGSTCKEDDYLWIEKCDGSVDEQWFVYESVNADAKEFKLKPHTSQDLCWTRTGANAHQLKPCGNNYLDEEGRDKQVLIGLQESGTFEVHPNGRSNDCMINHHHPKAEEVIRAQDCEYGRRDHTSLWVVHNPSGKGSLMPSKISDTLDCGVPDMCTTNVLNTDVNGITCGKRIQWLIDILKKSEEEACRSVANEQSECKPCEPSSTSTATTPPSTPPPPTSAATSPPSTPPPTSSAGTPPPSTARTSPSRTSTSTCKDSAEEFFVNKDAGSRDCKWLYNSQDRFGYLCRFVDVALECPVTCDICDRLAVFEL